MQPVVKHNTSHNELPQPDVTSAQHSERVLAHICERMEAAGGELGFAEFMQEALYAPGLGYYAAGAQKFGAAGDFVTAPELSPLFGRIVATQAAEVLNQLSGGSVLEPGAGSGALAATILARLAELNALPDDYLILEVSPELIERQRAWLQAEVPELVRRVSWLSEWPEGFSGVVIANEVVDALPVERFRKTDGEFRQVRVALNDSGLSWTDATASGELQHALHALEQHLGGPLPDGYESEISLSAAGWISDLAKAVARGFVFLFDYGIARHEYYAADRDGGWLRCHFRHRVHQNPLLYPGIQDITAWVNFSQVAEAAISAGMSVHGYVTQAHFLASGGLEKEIGDFMNLTERQRVQMSQEIKLLTMPGEMGENFKCIGLGAGDIETPSAFSTANRAALLQPGIMEADSPQGPS